MICVGVGFGSVGGGGLISIGVILVGNDVVSGCNDVGSRCNSVGLLVMAPTGLNGFNKGLNRSSDSFDSDFF